MSRRSRAVIYLRVAQGGRAAAQRQESDVRYVLAELGIDSHRMHVSCDIGVPGSTMGAALLALIEEARYGLIDTVIVRDVERLGREHSVLVSALLCLEEARVEVFPLEALPYDTSACARLRRRHADSGQSPRLSMSWASPTLNGEGE